VAAPRNRPRGEHDASWIPISLILGNCESLDVRGPCRRGSAGDYDGVCGGPGGGGRTSPALGTLRKCLASHPAAAGCANADASGPDCLVLRPNHTGEERLDALRHLLVVGGLASLYRPPVALDAGDDAAGDRPGFGCRLLGRLARRRSARWPSGDNDRTFDGHAVHATRSQAHNEGAVMTLGRGT
jgi:hypothetical protein